MTHPNSAVDASLVDAIAGLLPPLLGALEAFIHLGRHLHPANLAELGRAVGELEAPLREGLGPFRAAAWPPELGAFAEQVTLAAGHVGAAFEGLALAVARPDGARAAFRALRHVTRATEALYPVALDLPQVSRFFTEPGRRDDPGLAARLAAADPSRGDVGVLHAANGRAQRGGCSLYVPEYYDGAAPWPLVMALHGGSGHGRDFLWTWVREARSRGAILVSPTARGDTWSLLGRDVDSANLDAIVDRVRGRWNVDAGRMLLTGMSDGGTFAYVSGLRGGSPFTHLAPIAAAFHPMLLDGCPAERLRGLPIHVLHGARDWMFPVAVARTANAALTAAGAKVCYKEVEDLSHTYPRDENSGLLDWFLGA